jgi:hypothetical protein
LRLATRAPLALDTCNKQTAIGDRAHAMHDDKVSTLSFGIAAIMLAHAAAAWAGYVKGSPWMNLLGAAFVIAYALFGRRR